MPRDDIREAAKWYNSKLMGLGVRFTKEIREKVKFISGNPYEKLIIISAVLHTSRNPKSWKKR